MPAYHTFASIIYTHPSIEQVLRSIIPPQVEIPGSFSAVGHIIHLNLREEQLPFKWIIGAIMLDRCSQTNIRTIVNKLDEINHTFRFFKMEGKEGEEIGLSHTTK